MPSDRSSSTDNGRHIPVWIWLLTGWGIAGGSLVLGLLTTYLLNLREDEEIAGRQRDMLASITEELRTPLGQLEAALQSVFDPSLPAVPGVDIQRSTTLIQTVHQGDLPAPVVDELHQLSIELRAARDQIALCGNWRRQIERAIRRRELAREHTRSAVSVLRSTLDELLRTLPMARQRILTSLTELDRRAIQVAVERHGVLEAIEDIAVRLLTTADRIDKEVLRIEVERDAERLQTLVDSGIHPLLEAAHALEERLTELGAQTEARADVAPLLDALQSALLSSTMTAAPTGDRTGLVVAQHSWLIQRQRGAELETALGRRITRLQEAFVRLDQELTQAFVSAQERQREQLGHIWALCAAVAGAVGALFLLLARIISQSAKSQIRALFEARRAASDAARAQGEFLANMSHEIRTPMNGVLGMAELLEASELDEDQRQIARTIRSSADALLTVINDILDFSKIQAGKLELSSSDFDLRATVEDTLDLLGHLAAAKDLELLCFVDHRVPKLLHGDPDRLRQVLLNLAGNAIKFTDEGEVTVQIHLLTELEQAVHLQVAVRDTGVGIPEEAQARLFQPFTQADTATTRRFGGTGLGLTISKRLIQMMDGDITLESEPGVGSTFTFTVALRQATTPQAAPDAPDLSGHTALIVDDESTARELLALRLAHWRMGFDVAADAETALQRLREAHADGHTFDVALIDYQMPGTDGLQLAAQIGTDPALARTRCVLLSSAGPKPSGQTLAQHHLAAWITKPLHEDRLHQAIQQALGIASTPAATAQRPTDADTPLDLQVLVAEDNAINQRVLKQMLAKIGAHATFANNGREAVDLLLTTEVDLVLMDCQMPVLDGLAATREIRALPTAVRDIPVIALTANVLPADREACLAAGMNEFLTKPIKREELRAALVRWSPARDGARGDGDAE